MRLASAFAAGIVIACSGSADAPGPAADASDADASAAPVDGGAAAPPDATLPDGAPNTWRSALYPADWTPAFTAQDGLFLHDFSYAGYHHGQGPLGTQIPALIVDVVKDHAADASGASDATAAVQAAINHVQSSGGGVVLFPKGLYRFDGALKITKSNVVLRGEGPKDSRLYFTKSAGLSFASHITFAPVVTTDGATTLAQDGAVRADNVTVASAGNLAPGDDIVLGHVITDAFVAEHGMTGTWSAFNGTWQPIALRKIVKVEAVPAGARVTFDVPLRSPLLVRDLASVKRAKGLMREVGVEHLGLANAVGWAAAWAASQVHVLELDDVSDGWITDVESFSPPSAPTSGSGAGAHLQSSGIMVLRAKSFTIEKTRLANAENRGGGGNGYLFEIRQSNEILTRDSDGTNGRHNFIQNWGFGTSGCVWQRVRSSGGDNVISSTLDLGLPAYAEFHHSLATANLFDQSTFDDGLQCVNRGLDSTGAGHAGTENVFWNVSGKGIVRSMQWKTGYVIGTQGVSALVELGGVESIGTEPRDWLEGQNAGATLGPPSLYDDQLGRRLGH
jgi:hypothetical protein